MVQKWNLGREEMQFTKSSDTGYIDLLRFSPKTEEGFSGPLIAAAGPTVLAIGHALPWGRGEMSLHVVCGTASLFVWHPREQGKKTPQTNPFQLGDFTKMKKKAKAFRMWKTAEVRGVISAGKLTGALLGCRWEGTGSTDNGDSGSAWRWAPIKQGCAEGLGLPHAARICSTLCSWSPVTGCHFSLAPKTYIGGTKHICSHTG